MAIFSSEKRTSWVLDMSSSPNRVASAPYLSIIARGSTPLPRLLLMRRPSAAWITEWMYTSRNGISPTNSRPIITIRATHKKMISRAVVSTLVG